MVRSHKGEWPIFLVILVPLGLPHPQLHSVWDPARFACEIVKKDPSLLSFLPAMISDMVLLLIVLAGLFTIRRGGGATFGLAHLVWKQVRW